MIVKFTGIKGYRVEISHPSEFYDEEEDDYTEMRESAVGACFARGPLGAAICFMREMSRIEGNEEMEDMGLTLDAIQIESVERERDWRPKPHIRRHLVVKGYQEAVDDPFDDPDAIYEEEDNASID